MPAKRRQIRSKTKVQSKLLEESIAAGKARLSRWTHDSGDTIEISTAIIEIDKDYRELSRRFDLLKQQYDEILKEHAFLLRESARLNQILAVYRERRAKEVEAMTSTGVIALAG